MRLSTAAAAAFLASIVAANCLTSAYGLVPVGFGLVATAGTYTAGLTFAMRDVLHETAGRRRVLCCIAAGAALSTALSPRLALASGVAFLLAELADLAVYEPLRRRGRLVAALCSNVVGSVVDSLLFLALAGFGIAAALPGQLLGKLTVAGVLVLAVGVGRALLRHRVEPAHP